MNWKSIIGDSSVSQGTMISTLLRTGMVKEFQCGKLSSEIFQQFNCYCDLLFSRWVSVFCSVERIFCSNRKIGFNSEHQVLYYIAKIINSEEGLLLSSLTLSIASSRETIILDTGIQQVFSLNNGTFASICLIVRDRLPWPNQQGGHAKLAITSICCKDKFRKED
ncbi:hypothetical protein HPP92_028776 [Vanilla planifolia]|uniref:Uncharacterized protein n=1 Tax=Vanilla planifolia TaxID=51239 RepID=A0A835P6R9_VANPL|nr:hypothetical protein HPP92_028776 [Vanilla planifolia]KAG0446586.1 hypothetical protein HPP92_028765 [Vanilla planifolia]